MEKSYYIVRKPLQYFNATNIEDKRIKVLLLVDLFYNADHFFEEIKRITYWKKVLFFATTVEAYKYVKKQVNNNDYLYIDNDHGIRKNYWLSQIHTKNIFVYEEGMGSYRNDLTRKSKIPAWMKAFYHLSGVKEHFGGSKYVRGIYIYDIERHKNQVKNYKGRRCNFRRSFTEHARVIQPHFYFQLREMDYYMKSCKNKKIILYLTTWCFDEKIYNYIKESVASIKILKLHPHIKENIHYPGFDYILDNSLLIELFIMKILEVCHQLTVYHHNSGALDYIKNSKLTIRKL